MTSIHDQRGEINMRKLHLLSNAHLDPVWQWEWEEGAAAAVSTFRAAAAFVKNMRGTYSTIMKRCYINGLRSTSLLYSVKYRGWYKQVSGTSWVGGIYNLIVTCLPESR